MLLLGAPSLANVVSFSISLFVDNLMGLGEEILCCQHTRSSVIIKSAVTVKSDTLITSGDTLNSLSQQSLNEQVSAADFSMQGFFQEHVNDYWH